jgi:hypothetical protein
MPAAPNPASTNLAQPSISLPQLATLLNHLPDTIDSGVLVQLPALVRHWATSHHGDRQSRVAGEAAGAGT